MSHLLAGTPVREKIKAELAELVSDIKPENMPILSIIQVGKNDASTIYIGMKKTFGASIGLPVLHHQLEENETEENIIKLIKEQNSNPNIKGIIVQLPLPVHMNAEHVFEQIHPDKDVDGMHSTNVKKLLSGDPSGFVPATTRGILSLFDFYNISLEGKNVVVIGRSNLVGKPTALACLNKSATVTIAHSKTKNIKEICRQSDIIISAVGKPKFLNKEYVNPKQIIIDVGITSDEHGKIAGDVDFDEVFPLVAGLSPVPKGVGPLTVASLFQNLLRAKK